MINQNLQTQTIPLSVNNESFKILENQEKKISLLKKTRNDIFSIPDKYFNWKQNYSIKDIRKFPELQEKIILNEETLKLIINNFKTWKEIPTYLLFKNEDNGSLDLALASKRGNKIYEYYLNKKLEEDLSFMKDPNFHRLILRNKKGFRKKKVSNISFITLTCNPKRYSNNRIKAWINFEHDYNIFITRLRKKFGKCWIMKSVESTEKGYPHIHLLVKTEKEIDVFPYKNKEGFIEYRVCAKKEIEGYWPSFIDMIIPNSSKMRKEGCVNFMKDYIFKDMLKSYVCSDKRSDKNYLSLAMGWFFGKRCYSISKTPDLITETSVTQTQIEDIKKEKNWIFLGLVDLKFKSKGPPLKFLEIDKNDSNYEDVLNGVYGVRKKIVFTVVKPKKIQDFFDKARKHNKFKKELEKEKSIVPKEFGRRNVWDSIPRLPKLPPIEEFECRKETNIEKIIRKLGRFEKMKLSMSERYDLAIKGRC